MSASSPRRSASRTRRWATARTSRRWTTSSRVQAFVRNPRDGFVQPDQPYRLHGVDLRAPAPAPRLGEHTDDYRDWRRTARPAATGERMRDRAALRRPARARHDHVLGGAVVHAHPRDARRRADPSRVDAAPGRHPADRGHPGRPRTQWWEQSPIFSGLNTNKKGLTLDFQTERGRELLRRLIPTCDVIVENFTPRVIDAARPGLRQCAGAARRHHHGADARLRSGRPVAGQPRLRLHHRGRLRAELAHRVSRSHTVRAVLGGRPECRGSRADGAAAGARAPPPHRAAARWWRPP